MHLTSDGAQTLEDHHREELSRTASTVLSVAAKTGIRRIYMASDDRNASQSIQQLLRSANIKVLVAPPSNYSSDATKTDDAALLAFFVDVYALQKSTVFIGTASSNVGRFVYYLRDQFKPPNSSISLDEDWNNRQG